MKIHLVNFTKWIIFTIYWCFSSSISNLPALDKSTDFPVSLNFILLQATKMISNLVDWVSNWLKIQMIQERMNELEEFSHKWPITSGSKLPMKKKNFGGFTVTSLCNFQFHFRQFSRLPSFSNVFCYFTPFCLCLHAP